MNELPSIAFHQVLPARMNNHKVCSRSETPQQQHPVHFILHRPCRFFVILIILSRCQPYSSSDLLYFRPEVEDNQFRSSADCPVQPPCYCTPRQDAASHVIRIVCDTLSRQRRFPRFASTIDSVRQIWLTYSGLVTLPNLAFQALKVSY